MINYSIYNSRVPEIVLNIPGIITIDNKKLLNIIFEIDYDSFSKDELDKIILNNNEEFNHKTNCETYIEKKLINKVFIPINLNGEKKYLKIKTENNTINFSMIKFKIEIIKNEKIIFEDKINHSKNRTFSLSDGDYTLKVYIYNINDELIKINYISLKLKTNYDKIFSFEFEPMYINFNEQEGNFKLLLSTNSKKLYSFKIFEIENKNDNIFEFYFYNLSGNDKKETGKIGAEFYLLNDRQIEEVLKEPKLEDFITPKFAFEIKEMFSTTRSNNDIGVVRFPTIKQKIKDSYLSYYDLNCDVTQNYSVDFDTPDELLVTDKFNNYPLFYKFFIDTPFDSLKIIDSDNKEITDFIIENISEEVHIVYFNPLRNKEYYYILDNDPPLHIRYKRSIESYKMIFDKELEFHKNKLEFEYPMYFGDLMLKGDGEYDIEIQLHDYTKKNFKLKATNKSFDFLEDERIKINNKIKTLEIKTKDKVIAISMLCNFKHNRFNYSFFKSNFKDFVYIAQPVGEININDIPDTELSKFNINKKYIFKNGLIEEVHNGPLYLEDIKKTDIVFTDIEEWLKEQTIDNIEIIKTDIKDKFFLDNILNPVREVKYEDK